MGRNKEREKEGKEQKGGEDMGWIGEGRERGDRRKGGREKTIPHSFYDTLSPVYNMGR